MGRYAARQSATPNEKIARGSRRRSSRRPLTGGPFPRSARGPRAARGRRGARSAPSSPSRRPGGLAAAAGGRAQQGGEDEDGGGVQQQAPERVGHVPLDVL